MDVRLQRRVQRYGWDKASGDYERYWCRQLEPAQARLLELADLKSGEHVIDVACGTGLVTFPAAAAVGPAGRVIGPAGRVIGTDLSQEMVNRAAGEAAARRLDHVTFWRTDAEDLQLESRGFDAALCALGLMYVPDPAKAFREMFRVLRPGGRAVVAVWGARNRCGWAEIFSIVDRRVASEVCPMFFQLGTGDMLTNVMHAAGFGNIIVERIAIPLHYESPDEALGAAFVGGPVTLAYSRFDQQVRREAHAEYLASIETYRRGEQYDVPGEFVVARGTRPMMP